MGLVRVLTVLAWAFSPYRTGLLAFLIIRVPGVDTRSCVFPATSLFCGGPFSLSEVGVLTTSVSGPFPSGACSQALVRFLSSCWPQLVGLDRSTFPGPGCSLPRTSEAYWCPLSAVPPAAVVRRGDAGP